MTTVRGIVLVSRRTGLSASRSRKGMRRQADEIWRSASDLDERLAL